MFKKIAPLLIGAAAGALVVCIALKVGELAGWSGLAGGVPQVSGFGATLGLLAIMAVLVMVAILLHEVGHIAAALAVGSRVTRLYWGPFSFLFPERRILFTLKNKYFFGAMQNEILPYRDKPSFDRAIRGQRIVYAAGPAFSLVTGLVAWISATNAWSILGGYGIMSIGIGLATLFSDGVSAWMLGRRNYALISAWGMLFQAESLDESKLKFLQSESELELEEMTARPRPAKGRELFDLYVLYYAQLTGINAAQPVEETLADWQSDAKRSKMQRDAMVMVVAEEVVRLCRVGQQEQASDLYIQLAKGRKSDDPLLLKARAFIEGSDERAHAYLTSLRSNGSVLASFGALCEYEEQALQKWKEQTRRTLKLQSQSDTH